MQVSAQMIIQVSCYFKARFKIAKYAHVANDHRKAHLFETLTHRFPAIPWKMYKDSQLV